MSRTTGLVLGKFMPPHLGHLHLVEFAKLYVDDLFVVVGSLASEPIAGEQRVAWMRELVPRAQVLHLAEELPQHPSEHADFWAVWGRALTGILPTSPIDFVFASEAYGAPLATLLGARFVPVDIDRRAVPVSATAIRRDPIAHWAFLPRCVRPYFARRVCVFGPESTGKSTLCAQLAEAFDTVWVPEHARALLEAQGGRIVLDDIPRIARGQLASEDALARSANGILICDTDVLTTTIWSERLFGECPEWMRLEAGRRRYDLTLLCDVDVPWVADPMRFLPDDRRDFFDRCERALRDHGRRYVRISGNWDERFEVARAAVASLNSTEWSESATSGPSL